jgi:CheY-like chemotaxis protein
MAVGLPVIRTLVVDDSEEFLAVARQWVAGQDALYLAGTARSGLEALEAAERVRPDLVLMDAVMTGMDGFEATRRLKSEGIVPWIVVISFHDSQAVRHEAWAAGADGFVSKAELGEELLPLILRLTGGERRDQDPDPPGPPRVPAERAEKLRSRTMRPEVENEGQRSSVGFSAFVNGVMDALRRGKAAVRNIGRAQALHFEGPGVGAEKFRAARHR